MSSFSFGYYDFLGYGLVAIIIIAFAAAMSRFKDNVLNKLHHFETELKNNQSNRIYDISY